MPYCYKCGTQISETTKFCKACGVNIQANQIFTEKPASRTIKSSPQIKDVPISNKKMSMVLLLAILPGLIGLWGIGHIYLGKTSKGVLFLIASLFVYVIFTLITLVTLGIGIPFGLLVLAGWAWSSWDAYNIAHKMGIQ